MKYESKDSLIRDIVEQHAKLQRSLSDIPVRHYREPGVWGDDWTVHDLVGHLIAWHDLFLTWYRTGQRSNVVTMPAPGYSWRETPRLNRDLRDQCLTLPTSEVIDRFTISHQTILGLAVSLSSDELFSPGHFQWTGQNALVTYVAANTASHYRFALKVLKRWRRALRPVG